MNLPFLGSSGRKIQRKTRTNTNAHTIGKYSLIWTTPRL
ncbi:hypothetical protein LFML04_0669 [Leptospirillum ferriphilum ML-04]|uniref:Uncharacterized protein n=1 Tax=Leptospirillum ferriphilum (strain ML-04) TaxID=1048260 RepID=J9Z8X5_LEPFM|nr:hypothetical protein LFML04_0669 [Leptospirillum ferriphilum ML-04]